MFLELSMETGNLALKDRVDKSEWYRGYSPLSILLRGFFNLSNGRSWWGHVMWSPCSDLNEVNFLVFINFFTFIIVEE